MKTSLFKSELTGERTSKGETTNQLHEPDTPI